MMRQLRVGEWKNQGDEEVRGVMGVMISSSPLSPTTPSSHVSGFHLPLLCPYVLISL
jgi:hypothetical protein